MLGSVDAAIYRALFRDSEARFWGSRAVVDPRLSLAEVSRRTGIARTTVQARFSLWRRGDSGWVMRSGRTRRSSGPASRPWTSRSRALPRWTA